MLCTWPSRCARFAWHAHVQLTACRWCVAAWPQPCQHTRSNVPPATALSSPREFSQVSCYVLQRGARRLGRHRAAAASSVLRVAATLGSAACPKTVKEGSSDSGVASAAAADLVGLVHCRRKRKAMTIVQKPLVAKCLWHPSRCWLLAVAAHRCAAVVGHGAGSYHHFGAAEAAAQHADG